MRITQYSYYIKLYMKIKSIIDPLATVLYSCGISSFIFGRKSKHLYVLCYHKIRAEIFQKHLVLLEKYLDLISLEEFENIMSGNQALKSNVGLLTFDDGYESFYKEIYPVLKKRRCPALVFLVTDFVDTEDLLWHDSLRIATLNNRSSLIKINGDNYSLGDTAYKSYISLNRQIKLLPEEKRREVSKELREIIKNCEYNASEFRLLSWKQVKEMADNGIDFGSHTRTHPILSTVSVEEAVDEIRGSKKTLEDRLNRRISALAYPSGKPHEINDAVLDITKESGFLFAFTTVNGTVAPSDNPFLLKRVLFFDSQKAPMVALKMLLAN